MRFLAQGGTRQVAASTAGNIFPIWSCRWRCSGSSSSASGSSSPTTGCVRTTSRVSGLPSTRLSSERTWPSRRRSPVCRPRSLSRTSLWRHALRIGRSPSPRVARSGQTMPCNSCNFLRGYSHLKEERDNVLDYSTTLNRKPLSKSIYSLTAQVKLENSFIY